MVSRAGAAGFRARAGLLLIRFVLREGGALPEAVFDEEGDKVAEAPLWDPAVRDVSDWRLSGAAVAFVDWLWRLATEPDSPDAPGAARPATACDVVFLHALLEAIERCATGNEHEWLERAWVASPLTLLVRYDRWAASDAGLAALRPWLSAHWLLPYQRAWIVRRWLAADRRAFGPEAMRSLNERAARVLQHLARSWVELGAAQHLTLFVVYYAQWLRQRDGAQGLLRSWRQLAWQLRSVAEREAFEDSLGRLFEPVFVLVETATELRRLGWQRSAAEEYYLGSYAAELEPHVDSLVRLHHTLCRVVS